MIEIKQLKKYEPLYVIGHKKPDVDTVISSYLLSNILFSFGIECYPCILNEEYNLDKYNGRIIEDYLEYNPVVINVNDIDKYNFILVDHNDPKQSIGTSLNIVFGMDHHKNSGEINKILFGEYCSNALFIYDRFKEIYKFTDKEKELIFLSSLTDTLFFKTDRYTKKDKELVQELGINMDSEKQLQKYFIPTDLSKGIDKHIEKSDRDFSYFGFFFSSSVIHSLGNKKEEIIKYRELIKNKNDNHLGMWRDLTNNKTYAFLKINNYFRQFEYDFIAGRANTVMKDVLSFLKQIAEDKIN